MRKILKKLFIVMFWLLLWQAVVTYLNEDLLLKMPTPASTAEAFIHLSKKPEFWMSALYSLLRVVTAFLAAVAVATLCAVISNKYSLFSEIWSPVLRLMRALPVVAFIIIVLIWVKKEIIPQLITFITVVPIMWTSTEKALSSVDKNLIEMSKVMSLSRFNIFRYIIFPWVKPTFSANLITGLGFAWKSGVSAEILASTRDSLGEMLKTGEASMEFSEVFAVAALIVVLSILLEGALRLLLRNEVAK